MEEQWDIAGLDKVLAEEWQLDASVQTLVQAADAITDQEILEHVKKCANDSFAAKVEQVGAANFVQFERMVLLQSMDTHWREHLSSLDYLRKGIQDRKSVV